MFYVQLRQVQMNTKELKTKLIGYNKAECVHGHKMRLTAVGHIQGYLIEMQAHLRIKINILVSYPVEHLLNRHSHIATMKILCTD